AGTALGELAVLALGQGRFEQAEQFFEESLQLLREAGDRTGALQTLKNRAELPYARGDYAATWKLDEEALTLAESLADIHVLAPCKTKLGVLALLEGHDDDAEALFDEALAVQQELHDSNCSAISLRNLGVLALERGDVAVAQERLEQSLAFFTEIARQGAIARTQVCLGMALFATGNVQQAEDAYLTSLRIAQRLERVLWTRLIIAAGL